MRFALELSGAGVTAHPRVLAELAQLAEASGWHGVLLEDYIVHHSAPRLDVLRQVADLINKRHASHPLRVAVDGPDAAGKSILANEISEQLSQRGRHTIRASIDGFHRPRAFRYRRGADSPEGYYEDSFDHDALRRLLLTPLGPGGSRLYQVRVFDFRTDEQVDFGPPSLAPDDAVLVVDGVFLLRPELVDAWDFRIFVSVDFDEVLRRAVKRDSSLFGLSPEEVEARYRGRYLPGQHLYFSMAHPQAAAHVVVENTNPRMPRLQMTIA